MNDTETMKSMELDGAREDVAAWADANGYEAVDLDEGRYRWGTEGVIDVEVAARAVARGDLTPEEAFMGEGPWWITVPEIAVGEMNGDDKRMDDAKARGAARLMWDGDLDDHWDGAWVLRWDDVDEVIDEMLDEAIDQARVIVLRRILKDAEATS